MTALLPAEFIAEGVSLGIPQELQQYIYERWVAFREAHGLTAIAVEQPYVNDTLRVASNADYIDFDGNNVIGGDVKSAANPYKVEYVVQLGTLVGSRPYHIDTDEREDWDGEPTRACIYWFPLAQAIKAHAAGDTLPDWTLIEVDLRVAADLCASIVALRDTDVIKAAAFTPIATPTSSPSVVESPDGGDARTAATSPPSNLAEFFADIEANPAGGTIDVAEVTATIRAHRDGNDPPNLGEDHGPFGWMVCETCNRGGHECHFCGDGISHNTARAGRGHGCYDDARLDEQRARYKALSEGDKAAVARYWEANDVDLTDADAIAESIDAVVNFADVVTEPATTAPSDAPQRPQVATEPDEGADASDAAVDAVRERYGRLDAAAKSWVNGIAADAKRAGLDFHMSAEGGRRTMRRLRIMSALIALADGFDNDDAVRGSVANINAEVADAMSFNLGQVVGHLDADEAARFDEIAHALADGHAAMRFTPRARVDVEGVAA